MYTVITFRNSLKIELTTKGNTKEWKPGGQLSLTLQIVLATYGKRTRDTN